MIWSALAAVYLLWGSTYLGMRLTVETLPPLLSAAARSGVAGLVLATVLLIRRGRGALRVNRRELAGAALAGVLLLVIGNGLVILAVSGPVGVAVPTGIAALLVATVPLLVVMLRAATGDPPVRSTVLGVLVGFAGLVVLVLPGEGAAAPLGGTLLLVVAAIGWSAGSFLPRWIALPADPFVATVYQMATGALVLAATGLVRGEARGNPFASASVTSWLALGYLTVAGALVAFTAYVWLLQHAPISLTSTYAYVNPVVALTLGTLVLDEPVTPRLVVGAAVVLAGVALVVSVERRRAG